MLRLVCLIALVFLIGLAGPAAGIAPARADVPLPGPVPARVERVIDGDTLAVRARIWFNQDLRVRVRIAGIDTPERRGKCAAERALAARAKALVQAYLGAGDVELFNIRPDKYGGRVLADVRMAGGDLSERLLKAGLARPYDGGRRAGWCPAP